MTNDYNHEMFEDFDDLVTIDELMKMLKIGKTRAYELLKNEEIQSFKIGRKYKIPKIAIIDYISNCYN